MVSVAELATFLLCPEGDPEALETLARLACDESGGR